MQILSHISFEAFSVFRSVFLTGSAYIQKSVYVVFSSLFRFSVFYVHERYGESHSHRNYLKIDEKKNKK